VLYKFLNVPFFACHLTGIALLGVSYDLVFGWRPGRVPSGPAPLRVQPRLVGTLATILTAGLWAWGMAAKWWRG
jgi:hypothetical protein